MLDNVPHQKNALRVISRSPMLLTFGPRGYRFRMLLKRREIQAFSTAQPATC
jgi:hypothetical protein